MLAVIIGRAVGVPGPAHRGTQVAPYASQTIAARGSLEEPNATPALPMEGGGLRGARAAAAPDEPTIWRHRRFHSRARVILRVRWIALALFCGILLLPGWAAPLGLQGPAPWIFLGTMAALSLLHRLPALPLERLAPAALAADTLAATWLIASTGGLRSPFLALQVGLVALWVLLFPRPLAALPAVAMLPILAQLDKLLPTAAGGSLFDVLVIVFYGALDLGMILLLVYVNQREEADHGRLLLLERTQRELAVAEERSRLAREMHDGLGASLAGLAMQAELVSLRSPEGKLRQEAEGLRSGVEEALEELRHGLHLTRGDFNLAKAAKAHLSRTERLSGASLRLHLDEALAAAVPTQVQLHLFRVIQEAISNALRHGRAGIVEVHLVEAQGRCQLSIRDDGAGFQPGPERSGSYGLRGMRERAARCGGELLLSSAPGEGTQLLFTFPLLPPSRRSPS